MKYSPLLCSSSYFMSLPSRERGLKCCKRKKVCRNDHVAPFAGAWIEIRLEIRQNRLQQVAPFAGAWIEIDLQSDMQYEMQVAPFAGAWIEILGVGGSAGNLESLPSRERGLKSHHHRRITNIPTVAPFAGAWIEIMRRVVTTISFSSLPSRERGLKYNTRKLMESYTESLPSRERGLK